MQTLGFGGPSSSSNSRRPKQDTLSTQTGERAEVAPYLASKQRVVFVGECDCSFSYAAYRLVKSHTSKNL